MNLLQTCKQSSTIPSQLPSLSLSLASTSMALELLAKYTMPTRALHALDTLIVRFGWIEDRNYTILFQLRCPLQPQKITDYATHSYAANTLRSCSLKFYRLEQKTQISEFLELAMRHLRSAFSRDRVKLSLWFGSISHQCFTRMLLDLLWSDGEASTTQQNPSSKQKNALKRDSEEMFSSCLPSLLFGTRNLSGQAPAVCFFLFLVFSAFGACALIFDVFGISTSPILWIGLRMDFATCPPLPISLCQEH